MAIFNWTALIHTAVIAFNPAVDQFVFDDPAISAADLLIEGNDSPPLSVFTFGSKTVTLLKAPSKTKRDGRTVEEEMKRLDDLRVSGQLTKTEYDAARAAALEERDS